GGPCSAFVWEGAMSRDRRSCSPGLLARLQGMPVNTALDLLVLYCKADPDFKPVKNYETERLYVSIGCGVVELLVTGPKWYDSRTEKGGGGAIDLTMHLFRLDFVSAVKRLQSEKVHGQVDCPAAAFL